MYTSIGSLKPRNTHSVTDTHTHAHTRAHIKANRSTNRITYMHTQPHLYTNTNAHAHTLQIVVHPNTLYTTGCDYFTSAIICLYCLLYKHPLSSSVTVCIVDNHNMISYIRMHTQTVIRPHPYMPSHLLRDIFGPSK